LTLTIAADTFGQSSGATADVPNSASPKTTTASGFTSTSPTVASSQDKLARSVGNYQIIVPSKFDNESDKDKDGNKTKDKAASKTVAEKQGADTTSADITAPPTPTPEPAPTPSPNPQGQAAQFADRAFSRGRNAPDQTNLTGIRLINHVNGLIGGFDQGAGFGFGLEVTTAKGGELKGYEFYARAMGSTRLYRAGELGARVGTDKTRGEVWFNYTRRTKDNFFNLGPLSPRFPETDFATERRSYNGLFDHKFTPKIEGGLYGRLTNTGSFKGQNNDLIIIDALFSGNPNTAPITNFLPGLNQNVKLVSYGVFTEVDLRNNERGLTKGGYFYGRFGSVDGIDNGNAFSDFGWLEAELDGRAYIPILSNKTSLALRAYAVLRGPKGGSQIPFYDQAFLGGRSYERGFLNFRFRGNNSVLFSGEVRRTVWAQNDENTKGLDVVVFAEVGQVWGDNRSNTNPQILTNDDFDSRNYRTGFGGGFQYRMSKSLAFRIEIGSSNERTLPYLSLRSGF
jgi:hypothetical protein